MNDFSCLTPLRIKKSLTCLTHQKVLDKHFWLGTQPLTVIFMYLKWAVFWADELNRSSQAWEGSWESPLCLNSTDLSAYWGVFAWTPAVSFHAVCSLWKFISYAFFFSGLTHFNLSSLTGKTMPVDFASKLKFISSAACEVVRILWPSVGVAPWPPPHSLIFLSDLE